jgi:hypothetical protein
MCILRERAVNADRACWKPFAAPQDQFPQSHPFKPGFLLSFLLVASAAPAWFQGDLATLRRKKIVLRHTIRFAQRGPFL